MDDGYFEHIVEHPELSRKDASLVRRLAPGATRVVDLGCGRGGFVEICRQTLGAGFGLDNQEAAGRICRSLGLPFILGDAERLPFADASLDVVRAKEIIEHLQDPVPMMLEIRRVLRPGGLLLSHVPTQFSTFYPVTNFWDDYTHVRPLTRVGMRRLLEDTGFSVEFISGYTTGRNAVERMVGRVAALVFPFAWLGAARRPPA